MMCEPHYSHLEQEPTMTQGGSYRWFFLQKKINSVVDLQNIC